MSKQKLKISSREQLLSEKPISSILGARHMPGHPAGLAFPPVGEGTTLSADTVQKEHNWPRRPDTLDAIMELWVKASDFQRPFFHPSHGPGKDASFTAHTAARYPITWQLAGGPWLVPGTLSSPGKTTKAHMAPQVIRLCDHLNGITLLKFISNTVTKSWLPLKEHKKHGSFLMARMKLSHLFAFPCSLKPLSNIIVRDQLPHLKPSVILQCLPNSAQSHLLNIQLPLEPGPCLCSCPHHPIIQCSNHSILPQNPPSFTLPDLCYQVPQPGIPNSSFFYQNSTQYTRLSSHVPHLPQNSH